MPSTDGQCRPRSLPAGRYMAKFAGVPSFLSFALTSILPITLHVTMASVNPGAGAASCPRIHEQPISFDADRQRLTLEYIQTHYDPSATSIIIQPTMIVVHFTETDSLAAAYADFAPAELPRSRADIERGGPLNVSAHYLIDRDGTIYRLLPDSLMARHVIGLNRAAIGIENVGSTRHPLTAAQLRSDVALIHCLKAAHPAIRYVIGHSEYGTFRHTPLWEERDSTYFTTKPDPGSLFMTRLRRALNDSTLLGAWR
jgi:N-acetylmuramoyl-L-alanine amidase